MTDDTRDGRPPEGVVPFPEAASAAPGEINLGITARTDAVDFLKHVLAWAAEHQTYGRPLRSIVIAMNGVPGLWTFSNSTDIAEQCTLLRIALETKQRHYISQHLDYQKQELLKLAQKAQAEEGESNVLSFTPAEKPAAHPLPPSETFQFVDFAPRDTDNDPPPTAA